METPKSDAALRRFSIFTKAIHARLENGRPIYGDSSFERQPQELLEEIRQELLDVAGWAFIMYERLNELDQRMSNDPL
jgi:hypothetical protein